MSSCRRSTSITTYSQAYRIHSCSGLASASPMPESCCSFCFSAVAPHHHNALASKRGPTSIRRKGAAYGRASASREIPLGPPPQGSISVPMAPARLQGVVKNTLQAQRVSRAFQEAGAQVHNFSQKLRDNTKASWAEHYIDYARLKGLLRSWERDARRQLCLSRRESMADMDDDDDDGPAARDSTGQTCCEEQLRGDGGAAGGGDGSGSHSDTYSTAPTPAARMSTVRAGTSSSTHAQELTAREEGMGLLSSEPRGYGGADMGDPDCAASRQFQAELVHELDKVDRFYLSMVEQLLESFASKQHSLDLLKQLRRTSSQLATPTIEERDGETEAERASRKVLKALRCDYRDIRLVKNFCKLNHTGFEDILVRHDKVAEGLGKPHLALRRKMLPLLESAHFSGRDAIDDLDKKVVKSFGDLFCRGDLNKARCTLLRTPFEAVSEANALSFGYKLGMCGMLALWVSWDCAMQIEAGRPALVTLPAFPLFRGIGGILLLHWCWGLIEWACEVGHVNFVYLLDLTPENMSSPRLVFNRAVDETLIFLSVLLLYSKVHAGAAPIAVRAGVLPLLLILYTLYCVVFPWHQRKGVWHTIGKVLSAPTYPTPLFDVLVGNFMQSMVKVWLDLVWALAYLVSGDGWRDRRGVPAHTIAQWQKTTVYARVVVPLVVFFPTWLRFLQCLRQYWDSRPKGRSTKPPNRMHLVNAAKFGVTMLVTLFGAFHRVVMDHYGHLNNAYEITWFVLTIASTLCSYAWDVTMCWGLGHPEHKFLRQVRRFPSKAPYYVALVLNLALRFLWVNTIIPPGADAPLGLPLYLTTGLLVMEILRRTGWTILRLENAHILLSEAVPDMIHGETKHAYVDSKRVSNTQVLSELMTVAVAVIALSIGSVAAAERLNRVDAQTG